MSRWKHTKQPNPVWVTSLDVFKDTWGNFQLFLMSQILLFLKDTCRHVMWFLWYPKQAIFDGTCDCGKQNSYFKPNHHILLTITTSVFVHTTNQSIRTQTQSCNTKNRFGFSLSVVLHKLVTRFRWLTWICVRSTYSWYEILVLWLTELLVHEYLQLVALNSGTLYCVSPPLWVTVHLMSCALQGKDRSSTGEKEETSTFILHRILKSDYRRQYH